MNGKKIEQKGNKGNEVNEPSPPSPHRMGRGIKGEGNNEVQGADLLSQGCGLAVSNLRIGYLTGAYHLHSTMRISSQLQ